MATDFATFIVAFLIVFGGGIFLLLLLSPLIVHMRWENRQRRRGGRYIR